MTRSLFRHILVPHDFSSQATVALKTAAKLANEHRGKLTVLHVRSTCPLTFRSACRNRAILFPSIASFSSAW